MLLLNRCFPINIRFQTFSGLLLRTFCTQNERRVFEGAKAAIKKRYTVEEVECFCHITGDTNSIHFNDNVARNLGFASRLVPGALLNSLVARVFGTHLPGFGTVVVRESLHFCNPLYVDEEVTAEVVVESIKKSFIECNFKCEVLEMRKVVLEGSAILLLKDC